MRWLRSTAVTVSSWMHEARPIEPELSRWMAVFDAPGL